MKKNSSSNDEIYVLDAGVFINGMSYLFQDKLSITTPFIEEEIKSSQAKMDFYRFSLQDLNIVMPSKESMERAKKILNRTNHKLSPADLSLLALCIEYKNKNKEVVLVTDDYSLQDVASSYGIKVEGIVKEKTKERYRWKRICPACNRENSYAICEVCGTKTKYVRS